MTSLTVASSLDGSLQRIVDTARVRGVSIEIDRDGGVIHIPDLYRHKGHPGSEPGDGMEVLRRVCAVADEFGCVVEIEYMADEPKLGELYGSCGFIRYNYQEVNPEIINLRRVPCSTSS